MVNIIDTVNPNYQKSIDEAGKKTWGKMTPASETTENDAAGTAAEKTETAAKPNEDTYVPEDKEAAAAEKEAAGKTYKPNTALVEQMKNDMAQIQSRFVNMVKDMLGKQGKTIAEGDGFWKFMASGDYEVDEETQKAAQEAISENGYWGVKQTSERIVNFAKALTGGNPEKIGLMRDAFEKGYAAAEKSWGGALPGLAQDTRSAVHDLFDQWEKESKTENAGEQKDGTAAAGKDSDE